MISPTIQAVLNGENPTPTTPEEIVSKRTHQVWQATGEHYVHLQGIGLRHAIPASALEAGMKKLYNYGYNGEILSTQRMGNWIVLVVRERAHPDSDGRNYRRKHKPDTLIPVLI